MIRQRLKLVIAVSGFLWINQTNPDLRLFDLGGIAHALGLSPVGTALLHDALAISIRVAEIVGFAAFE
jgi:hypothetical protein